MGGLTPQEEYLFEMLYAKKKAQTQQNTGVKPPRQRRQKFFTWKRKIMLVLGLLTAAVIYDFLYKPPIFTAGWYVHMFLVCVYDALEYGVNSLLN